MSQFLRFRFLLVTTLLSVAIVSAAGASEIVRGEFESDLVPQPAPFANVFFAACIDPSCIDLGGFGYGKAFERYKLTAGYRALAEKPLFKEWQAEHDRVAAALAEHRDPLQ